MSDRGAIDSRAPYAHRGAEDAPLPIGIFEVVHRYDDQVLERCADEADVEGLCGGHVDPTVKRPFGSEPCDAATFKEGRPETPFRVGGHAVRSSGNLGGGDPVTDARNRVVSR